MDPNTSRLNDMFGSFPEAVILLMDGAIVYGNEHGQRLLQEEAFPQDLLFALAEHPGDAIEVAMAQAIYRVTVSPFEGGYLLVMRLQPSREPQEHPFSHATYRLRESITNLTTTHAQLRQELEERYLDEAFLRELANENRFTYQLLRLVRQAELNEDLNNKTFPREEGFDLAQVCSGMADEAVWLAEYAGVRFSYTSNVTSLPFQASKSLITQMILAVISNAIRAAGKGGHVEMRFQAVGDRCMISIRDSGMGIPEDRMPTLFTSEVPTGLPRPGEGSGLGLYNAQRIATLHGGIMVAQSGRDGGTTLAISLPIVTPPSVPVRNNPGYDNPGGYSPVLIEMSDILPWEAFNAATRDD